MIRLATAADIPAVANIYEKIHDREARGLTTTGWLRGVYPTADTARLALEAGELYVLETEGQVAAAARINGAQVPVYAQVDWAFAAPAEQVLVLHTLVVDPELGGRGHGRAFVAFYEALALTLGRPFLRIDTNARNTAARAMYRRLGFREAGVVPCEFNGIPDVALVCLEKRLVPEE